MPRHRAPRRRRGQPAARRARGAGPAGFPAGAIMGPPGRHWRLRGTAGMRHHPRPRTPVIRWVPCPKARTGGSRRGTARPSRDAPETPGAW